MAVPHLKQSINGLKKLTKAEITELKTIKKPSIAVYLLMKCVCILMDLEPKRVKIKDEINKYGDDWWSVAISSKVLNDFRLVEKLSNYNPEKINSEIMIRIGKASQDPEFTLENI